jgi:hypothetical protein
MQFEIFLKIFETDRNDPLAGPCDEIQRLILKYLVSKAPLSIKQDHGQRRRFGKRVTAGVGAGASPTDGAASASRLALMVAPTSANT